MDPTAGRGDRLTFALVAAAFLGTPLVAALWYAYGDAGHGARMNHGTLIDPPRPIVGAASLGVTDAWTLVVQAADGCDNACTATLLLLRQVRLSLGHDAERVARVLVSGRPDADRIALAAAHPDLRVLAASDAGTLVAVLGTTVPGQSIVVDPLGNAMLTFAPATPPADIKADLVRLLKNSQSWMR